MNELSLAADRLPAVADPYPPPLGALLDKQPAGGFEAMTGAQRPHALVVERTDVVLERAIGGHAVSQSRSAYLKNFVAVIRHELV